MNHMVVRVVNSKILKLGSIIFIVTILAWFYFYLTFGYVVPPEPFGKALFILLGVSVTFIIYGIRKVREITEEYVEESIEKPSSIVSGSDLIQSVVSEKKLTEHIVKKGLANLMSKSSLIERSFEKEGVLEKFTVNNPELIVDVAEALVESKVKLLYILVMALYSTIIIVLSFFTLDLILTGYIIAVMLILNIVFYLAFRSSKVSVLVTVPVEELISSDEEVVKL